MDISSLPAITVKSVRRMLRITVQNGWPCEKNGIYHEYAGNDFGQNHVVAAMSATYPTLFGGPQKELWKHAILDWTQRYDGSMHPPGSVELYMCTLQLVPHEPMAGFQ
jgi:hypothetical protein